ncbi:hypothetical protein IWQ60_003509 [Tieghemiomyces parasiticus]|uniref:C-CAP/cofactor C-like domain-containing protein n=1 Tax=Tieghemiomyces parasiticus TaxID=78921 RepID=A0A9W8AAP1_9FUNG|nr:hypothetical protein IWQ60_003509 [Tieghemiomyces parasiticus]
MPDFPDPPSGVSSAPSSSAASAQFWTEFQATRDAISEEIAAVDAILPGTATRDRRTQLLPRNQALFSRVLDLEAQVTQALVHLPPYDERLYRSCLDQLKTALRRQKDALTPRSKFSFRSQPAASSTTSEPTATLNIPNVKPHVPSVSDLMARSSPSDGKAMDDVHTLVIADLCRQHYRLPFSRGYAASTDATLPTSLRVNHCRDAVLDFTSSRGRLASVFLRNLQRCIVVLGPLAGSVYVDDCVECTVVVACRQLRVHTSRALTFVLHTTSDPIIEDCTGIRVAPYPTLDPTNVDHAGGDHIEVDAWRQANLISTVNRYDQVDDFKWLRRQRSPNWSVLVPGDELAIVLGGYRRARQAPVHQFNSGGATTVPLDWNPVKFLLDVHSNVGLESLGHN